MTDYKTIREDVQPAFSPEYATFGHGTTEEAAKSIIEEGLEAKLDTLGSTAKSLPSGEASQRPSQEVCELLMDWPHKNYENVVLVGIPHPPEDKEVPIFEYHNAVFEPIDQEEPRSGYEEHLRRSYRIPPKFISGYFKADEVEFHENPSFDPEVPEVSKENRFTANIKPAPNGKDETDGDEDLWIEV